MPSERNTPTLTQRMRRAIRQSIENPYSNQLLISAFVKKWAFLLNTAVAIVSILALDENNAKWIYGKIIEFRLQLAAALVTPYALKLFAHLVAVIARFRETYAPSPKSLFSGVPVSPSTGEFAKKSGHSAGLVIGGAIEIASFPFLDKDISNNGWASDQVILDAGKVRFPLPKELDSGFVPNDSDGLKYALSGCRIPRTDDYGTLKLEVKPSTYFDIQNARKLTDHNQKLRHSYSSLDPLNHRIPNSLCLHFICVFDDGNILAMKRKMDLPYFPGVTSFSAEEQLSEIDFTIAGVSPAESLFRRAICEEVFPLRGKYSLSPRDTWSVVREHVVQFRYWSVLFEEIVGNFALFGVCQLKGGVPEYRDNFLALESTFMDSRDDEGDLFFISQRNVRDYLRSGHGSLSRLSIRGSSAADDATSVPIGLVHPTAAYRASRLISCLEN